MNLFEQALKKARRKRRRPLGYFVSALCWTAGASALLTALVWLTDPFVYYRAPGVFKHIYSSSNSRQMVPGMLRHCDYDALVVGHSQAQNFMIPELREKLGWQKTMKATVAASYPAAMRRYMEIAFEHRNPRHVMVGLLPMQFRAKAGYLDRPLPDYLYTPRWTTANQYLFNTDVVFDSMPKSLFATFGLGTAKNLRRTNPDMMFMLDYDEEGRVFDARKVENLFKIRGTKDSPAERGTADPARYMESFDQNFRPFLDRHPDTRFIFLLLPLPHMEWYKLRTEGCIDAMLVFIGQMGRAITAYPNAEIHDFITVPEFVNDLNNFRDLAHFSSGVSSQIITRIASGENRLTAEDIPGMVERLRQLSLRENQPGWVLQTLDAAP